MDDNNLNFVNKSIKKQSSDNLSLKTGEIELINKFSRKKLTENDVYVFSIVLCDNCIDRQNERFSDDSLEKLAELFVGKTGIMDHDIKSKNQTARIFSCEVQTDILKTNELGNPYKKLVARAYMPKTEKNENIIADIESGIKKEVSINCAVQNITCSICGTDRKSQTCNHTKGEKYKSSDVICHDVLENPIDAYEWSFVVVPAQKNAGVIKSFKSQNNNLNLHGETDMNMILKKLSTGAEIKLSSRQSLELYKKIKSLEENARIGSKYFKELKSEVVKLARTAQPEIPSSVMEGIVEKMSLEELKSFKDAYKKTSSKNIVIRPQLSCSEIKPTINTQFKI